MRMTKHGEQFGNQEAADAVSGVIVLGKVGRGRAVVLKTSLADRAVFVRDTLGEKSEA